MRQKPNSSSQKVHLQREIYKTLAYSAIFHYPLTGDQIFLYLGVPIKGRDFLLALHSIPHSIVKNTLYYFLPKQDDSVHERIQKEKISYKKMEKAKRIIRILGFLPTIRFIGISGSLALSNAETKSDSDICIIASSHTLWITRFFIYLFLFVLGIKRGKKNISNAICTNMFLSDAAMRFSGKKRNLYVAHEIVQMLPIVNKSQTHEKFLAANAWVAGYFPNLPFYKKTIKKIAFQKENAFSIGLLFSPLEYMLMHMQLWYMRNRITRETISSSVIAFHPIDYEGMILEKYNERLKAL